MRHVLFSIVAAFCAATVSSAQAQGIRFEGSETSFRQAVEKALKSRKLIFMDCYTAWCGPCRQLTKNVFPNDTVGAFFNRHFVSLKMDMEKGEGPKLAKQYQITAYPTLLFIDPHTQKMVYRMVGSKAGIQWLMDIGQKALDNEENLTGITARYQQNPQDAAIVSKYLTQLQAARLFPLRDSVLNVYLANIAPANDHSQLTWQILSGQVSDPYGAPFEYMNWRAEKFRATVGNEAVDEKLETIYRQAVMSFIRRKRIPAGQFPSPEFARLNVLLKDSYQGQNKAYYLALLDMVGCVQRGDYNAMLDGLDKADKNGTLAPDTWFYFVWLNLTYLRESTDTKAIDRGLAWLERLRPDASDENFKRACQNMKDTLLKQKAK